MSDQKVAITPSPAESDRDSLKSKAKTDDEQPSVSAPATAPALAAQETQRMEAALGDAILRFLKIRKRPKSDEYDLDAVCPTQCLSLKCLSDV